jgi:hypothetical protein
MEDVLHVLALPGYLALLPAGTISASIQEAYKVMRFPEMNNSAATKQATSHKDKDKDKGNK